MKTPIFLLAGLFIWGIQLYAQKNDVEAALQTIDNFVEADPYIQNYFDKSHGYAVFPGIGKGGLGVGAASGKGTVFLAGRDTADVKMTQLTVGLQAGGQKYAEVIFFEDQDVFERFMAGNYEFAAQVSAVALKSGASADAEYRDGIMVFTMAIGGLMYEASVGGQKFKVEVYE